MWNRIKNSKFFQTLVSSFGINVANMLTGIIAARYLLPQGRGELAAVQLWGTVIASLSLMGLDQAAIYFLPRIGGSKRGSVISTLLGLTASISLIVTCSTVGYILLSGGFEGTKTAMLRFLPAIFIPLNNMAVVLVSMLLAVGQIGRWNLARASVHYLWVATMGATFLMGFVTPAGAAWAWLAAILGTLLIAAANLRISISHNQGATTATPVAHSTLLSYGVRVQGATVFRILAERSDQLAVTLFLGAHALGLYVVALVLLRALAGVLASFEQLLFRGLLDRISEEKPAPGFIPLLAVGLGSAMTLSILIWIIAPTFVRVMFGLEFVDSVPVLRIFCWMLPATVGRLIVGSFLKANNWAFLASTIDLCALIVLCGSLPFLLSMSIGGVSIAVTMSSWCAFLVGLVTAAVAMKLDPVPLIRSDLQLFCRLIAPYLRSVTTAIRGR